MTKAKRKSAADKEYNWENSHEAHSPSKKSSLLEQMKQEPVSKPRTTRFTLDLEPDYSRKLEIMAQRTNRSKASVIKFLIDNAFPEFEI